jgi:hypothetical protein
VDSRVRKCGEHCTTHRLPCQYLSIPCQYLSIPCQYLSIPCQYLSIPCQYLVNTIQKNWHPPRDKLEKLNDLSPQKCLIPYHEVSGLDIQPEVGYTRYELGALQRNLFYTDGSLMDGFAVHHSIDFNIRFRMRGSASVFTAELAAIRMAMDHI